MDEYFAAMPVTNATVLCVGGITRSEAAAVTEEGIEVDGRGYYLFLANAGEPRQPIQVLAKFLSDIEAAMLARLISAHAS